jgi:hypothetical protein
MIYFRYIIVYNLHKVDNRGDDDNNNHNNVITTFSFTENHAQLQAPALLLYSIKDMH